MDEGHSRNNARNRVDIAGWGAIGSYRERDCEIDSASLLLCRIHRFSMKTWSRLWYLIQKYYEYFCIVYQIPFIIDSFFEQDHPLLEHQGEVHLQVK